MKGGGKSLHAQMLSRFASSTLTASHPQTFCSLLQLKARWEELISNCWRLKAVKLLALAPFPFGAGSFLWGHSLSWGMPGKSNL